MNVIPLLKAKALILENPDCYSQNVYDCGTAACVVGIAARVLGFRLPSLVCLGGPDELMEVKKAFTEAAGRVQKSLKLSDTQWNRLVHIANWPAEFKNKFSVLGNTPKERAITAGKRIDKFISTDGME